MTFANILIYVLLIALVLARRFRGHPIADLRKLLALPVILTVIGYGDLTHGGLKPIAVTLTVIGAALSLGLGALRGRADKVSERDGSPYVQWGIASLVLFCVNIAAKLVLDVIGVAAGETFATAGKSRGCAARHTSKSTSITPTSRASSTSTRCRTDPSMSSWRGSSAVRLPTSWRAKAWSPRGSRFRCSWACAVRLPPRIAKGSSTET